MFNPDQVWHDFLFPQPSSQLGNHLFSENTTSERSELSETAAFSQVNTSAVANHSGLQGLDQSVDLVAPIIDSVQEILDTDASTPQEWYTPPQTPPFISSHVNAFDSQVHPPSDSLYVYGSIADRSTLMLVDTGASVTAVSSNFVSTFTVSPKLQPSPISSIQTVSGEHLPVLGQVNLPLTIGANAYPFETLVIDNLTYPVVLGRNFLMHFGSVIDLQDNTLTLTGTNSVPLHSSSPPLPDQQREQAPVTVHALATYILPPMSESVIPVYPKSSLPVGKTGLIEPSAKLIDRYHVCGASQLVSLSEQHTFPFRILNPTQKPVTIYRCTTVGTFTPSAASMSVIATSDTPAQSPPPVGDEETVPLDFTSTNLDEHQLSELKSLIAEYRAIFALKPEELGRTGLVKHRIDTGDNPPIRQRPYRVSESQRGIIEEHVTDMLNRGIIQPSTSLWASPITLVQKKDRTDRFVVDFRRLNSVTRKDSYALPRIDHALDALNGTKFFSCMNLMSGFWQVEMESESREHTAFVTYGGLNEFLVLPFGLTGAPSTYQRLMECVLRNLTYKICLIYLDDILVYSKTFEDHLSHLRQVFDRLRHANLKLKPSKCKFACPKVKYLGHVVSPEGIAPDDDKIAAVRDFPRHNSVKTVRSFLGLANYYQRFIKDFAKIASPSNQLLRKDHKFLGTDACEQAFKALKEALISAPILAFPDFKETFQLYTDASNEGVGVTLAQIQNGREVAIAYAGRDFNSAEKDYSTTQREALAVIFGIK